MGGPASSPDPSIRQPFTQLTRRILRGLAVQIRSRRSRRRRRIRHLARICRRDAHALEVHAKLMRDDLRHLRVQALTHFGAAVIHKHRTIGINVNQRTCLIEVRHIERDAELHRRQHKTLLENLVVRFELVDLGAATAIFARLFQLRDQLINDVVFDGLPVRRFVVLRLAIKIRAAHVE